MFVNDSYICFQHLMDSGRPMDINLEGHCLIRSVFGQPDIYKAIEDAMCY
jgi:hypothetical protein